MLTLYFQYIDAVVLLVRVFSCNGLGAGFRCNGHQDSRNSSI